MNLPKYATLALELVDEHVLVATLNRPEVLNAKCAWGSCPEAAARRTCRAVGERRAKELILAARPFTAEEAYEWGLVNRSCEPGKTLADALVTARAIAENAPLSVRQAKKSIHYGLQTDIATGYRFEIEAYNRLVTTEDRIEGVRVQ